MPPQSQVQNQMTPEEAKASLGIATHLMSFLMPQGGQNGPQTPAQAPSEGVPQNQQNPTDVKAEMQGLESRLMDELQTLKAEMKTQSDSSKELADLKKKIETVLASTD